MPWFVSDVTGRDFNWTIEMLIANSDCSLRNFGVKCSQRLCDVCFFGAVRKLNWRLRFEFVNFSLNEGSFTFF